MQRKLCQRGKIGGVHLVQLRKIGGDAHACTELTDKLDHCRGGSVRGKSALQAHGSGNGHEPLPAHRAAAVEGQHVGQHHRIAHTVGQVVVSAQRVCHRMHHAKARVGESHACHIFGVGHHGAGGFILTVGNGPGQVLRGRDPLAPHSESYAALLLYSRESANPLTVNPVLTRDNDDIGVVYDYLCNRLHRRVRISECFPVRGLHGCADSLAMSDEQIFGRWLPAAIHCLRTRPLEDFPLFRYLYYALLYNIVTGTPAYPRGRCTAYADKPFAVDMEGRCLLCHAETPTYRFPRNRDGADTVNAVMTLDDMMRENMDDIAARFRAARHLEDWRDMPRCRDCVSLNACWGCCPKEAGGDLESGCAVNYAVGLVPLNLMFHMMHKNVIGMDIRPEADA